MYRNATPPITWNEYCERYGSIEAKGFEFHFLPETKCMKIWDKYKKKCNKIERDSFSMTVLNFAPISKKRKIYAKGKDLQYNRL